VTAGDALREVRLVGFPLAVSARAQEHHEELMREFQLLALDPDPGHGVPQRLVTLVEEMTAAYAGFTDAPNAARDAAHDRGEAVVDLTYWVPQAAGDAATRLDRMLDEADEFCRAGDGLLTLAAPAEAAALRHWQLSEFAAQVGGAEPTPWADWLERHPLPVA
jgi:hypothetical protein